MGFSSKWNSATPIGASGQVQSIHTAHYTLNDSGHRNVQVQVRYNRSANEVLVLFPLLSSNAKQAVVGDLAKALGERAATQMRQGEINEDIIIQIPAQSYVDRLGGYVSGIVSQVY